MFQRLCFVKIVDFNSLICYQQIRTGRHTDGTFKESYNSNIFYWNEIGGKAMAASDDLTISPFRPKVTGLSCPQHILNASK